MTTLPCSPRSTISAISLNALHSPVPVEPPALRPMARSRARTAATLAASGTFIIRSMAPGTKLGSMRGRPMPSMREPRSLVACGSWWVQPSKKQEFSGSGTQMRVSCWR
ncbi:hypothetical protein SBADM41S_06345 [Streptomyces badius]